MRFGIVAVLAASLALAGCAKSDETSSGGVTAAMITSPPDGEWLTYGRDYGEQRYSPLDKINLENVKDLGLAWSADLDTARGQEGTPLMIGGKLYITTAWSKVKAYDGKTGKLLWEYDPKVPGETGVKACCDVVNRGLGAWGDKLFLGTLDGRLIALDRETGKEIWSQVTVDQSKAYTITGAPRVVKGKVIIGNGGAEYGVRGYVTAYDADSGKQLWRFYTVPGAPEEAKDEPEYLAKARKTWNGEFWKLGGGGTVWDSMAYDPELDLLYIGVGNGSPWVRKWRSPGGGDNLFLASIMALDVRTGKYVWHYQTTPGEEWDYTATQQMILADIELGGKQRKVLMQAPKNGFFYILDRVTGELLSAEKYVPITWASHVDMKTGRPVENPQARYGEVPVLISPGAGGGHNWNPMAYSPLTGLVYIPVTETYMGYAAASSFDPANPGTGANYTGYEAERKAITDYADKHSKAWLSAWNPRTGKEAWRVPAPLKGSGGVLATAGNLVFEGTIGATFAAYRADTGEKVWELPVQNVPIAAPITYMVDGEQYVAVNTGWGGGLAHVERSNYAALFLGKPRLLVFKLGGKASLPPPPEESRAITELSAPPKVTASAEVVAKGEALYGTNCALCHGVAARGGVKDLRHMTPETHQEFLDIVIGGKREANGMASFADILSKEDAEAIHQYVIARANIDWNGN